MDKCEKCSAPLLPGRKACRYCGRPINPAFPLLYKSRPLNQCGDPVGTDARWRGVTDDDVTIEMIDMHGFTMAEHRINRLDALDIYRAQR